MYLRTNVERKRAAHMAKRDGIAASSVKRPAMDEEQRLRHNAYQRKRYAERKKDPEWHANHLKRVKAYSQTLGGRYRDYKDSAKERGLCFELTMEELGIYIEMDCFYCGLKGGGIDRYDNDKGYIVENCVSCCKHCNYAKRNRSPEDFSDWIEAIAKKWMKDNHIN